MTDEHEPTEFDDLDAGLDDGLQAAFGPGPTTASMGGVLTDLEARFGIESQILLREEADDRSPPVQARAPAQESFSKSQRYQMIGEIARGGVGIVLKGRDVDLGRDIAVKVLQERHAKRPAMIRRFVEEAQIAGQLQHPGVLPVYELGLQADRLPYFTMKLVKGRTLAELLRERKNIDDDRARFLKIFESVCQTIAYAHSRGVVHRDLKPGNILVGAFGEVQVVDWGLSKVLVRSSEQAYRTERTEDQSEIIQTVRSTTPDSESIVGSVMGTPAYMSPEQARGATNEVDERSDVFALGAMLCEILTGAPPFDLRLERSALLKKIATCDLDVSLSTLEKSGVETDLVQLTRTCLAADKEKRPRNAGIVAERITMHLASTEERARESELAARAAQAKAAEERRARRLTIALTAVVLLVVLGISGGAVWWQQQRLERENEATQRITRELDNANLLLGQALASPVGENDSWIALRASSEHVERLVEDGDLHPAAHERAASYLDRFREADRERNLVELIEDVIIRGATHPDAASWRRMSRQLHEAFEGFGIDLTQLPTDETISKIRDSELAVQLTEGIELWIGTEGQLGMFGEMKYSKEHLFAWVDVLYEADPDPFRVAQRRIYYAMIDEFAATGAIDPSRIPNYKRELDELVAAIELKEQTPRSLSWLATCYSIIGAPESALQIFRDAIIEFPRDFMLISDYAMVATPQQMWLAEALSPAHAERRWQETIRAYVRCLTIRPNVGGIWRSLGNAYRVVGETGPALVAYERAIDLQPDHAPIYVDLGELLMELGNLDRAIERFQRALALDDSLAIAHCRYGLALQERGELEAALQALQRGHDLGSIVPFWQHPSQEWIDTCRAQLEAASE